MSDGKPKAERCTQCGKKIRTMIYRGTGVCCDNCRKARDGDDAGSGRN